MDITKENKAEVMRLPATVIQRIVKDALPANASVSKEARGAIGRAAAIFIMNLVTTSNDFALSRKRKQITAEDIYQGVKVIEYEQFVEPLKKAVELWKNVKAQKSEEAKKRKLEKASEGTPIADEEDGQEAEERVETPAEDEEEDVVGDDVSQESTGSSQDEDDVSQEIDATPSPAGTEDIRDTEDF